MKAQLKNWEKATEELTELFIDKYFDDDAEIHWIASEIGGVLSVNDYFFDLRNITDFIRYNYSQKNMFKYYDYSLERAIKDDFIVNIKNYKEFGFKETPN